jgi:hypothetical protein
METTKILLNENREQAMAFQMSVNDVISRSNELIFAWNTFQDFQQVSSYNDFLELVTDPVGTLDKFLIGAVNIKSIGTAKLNPEVIASMLNIDRQSWINIVEGRQAKTDCIPCKKIRVKKGQPVISLHEFQRYEKYMTFQKGRFVPVTDIVKQHTESMKVFTESPEQIATYKHWQDLLNVLTEHKKRGYLGSQGLREIAKLTGLKYVPDLNELFIDEFKIQK